MNDQQQDQQKPQQAQLSHIQGWGADLDHANRPAYPMERTPPRYTHPTWETIPEQPQRIELLKSNERPTRTPVFGTSTPPTGLSGMLRRGAFKFTENDIRHWMILLLADRVNMVEGIVSDIGQGHVPNIYAEMGLKSEFKYNRQAAVKKLAVAGFVLGAAVILLQHKRNSPKRMTF